MAVLAFVLECAAVAAIAAAGCSLAALVLTWLLRVARPVFAASRRADLSLLLSLAPAVGVLAIVAATALPPISSALGMQSDDCFSHDHHGHLCLVHLGSPRPALMMLGAAALALFVFRAVLLAGKFRRASADVALLETLGQVQRQRFPIIWVPGAPRLCLATGVLRRRILVSLSLAEALEPAQLEAALAHERAHLLRADPLVSMLLQLSSLLLIPFVAGFLAREHAALTEEACDQDAAREVGEPALVAEALVKVAALASQTGPALAFAFGRGALENRVRALLGMSVSDSVPLRLPLLLVSGVALASTLLITLSQSDAVHHAVETLLHELL